MNGAAATRPLLSQPVSPPASDNGASHVWSDVCDRIMRDLPEQAFSTWFRPLKPVEFESGTLTVHVPSRFYYDWIEGHYAGPIERAMRDVLGPEGRLVYVTSAMEDSEPQAPISVRETRSAPPVPKEASRRPDSGLNKRYVFETFIEGPQNQFARAVALAVAQSPGKTPYNPLLVYGGVGLGKTHLLQAIGNEAQRKVPELNVQYISIERFTQDFVESIKQNRADAFSNRFRTTDLLLIDDVQFLIGRERTQLEFFHMFNDLHQAGKQIVLTSDKPPRELAGLDERLVSRFAWGLVCDIAPPDYDTRVAIIQSLSEAEGVMLDPEVVALLARRFTRNVREMQGALIRLLAHTSLTGEEISREVAGRALRDLMTTTERRINIDTVQRIVAEQFDVAPDLLMAKIRTQPIARARMVAMALSVRLTGLSLKQVGSHFGKRDHTTVLHAREKVSVWEQEDPQFSSTLRSLVRRIEEAVE